MNRHSVLAALVLAVTALAGCGGDEDTKEAEVVENPALEAQGAATATNASDLKQVTGDDEASKVRVHNVGQSLVQLRGQYVSATTDVPSGLPSLPTALLARAQGAQMDVAPPSTPGTGTLTYTDNHLSASFTYESAVGAAEGVENLVFTYVAELDIVPDAAGTSTTVDGTFDEDFDATVDLGALAGELPPGTPGLEGTLVVKNELSATYAGVLVGACPESGTLTLDYALTVAGGTVDATLKTALEQRGQLGTGKVVVTFGKDDAGACTTTVSGT
jgi:hypothetical protein